VADSSVPDVNPPQQLRSQETLAHLLKATSELLETTVFEDLTIQQIAARAGCSVGTFYGRFRNKDAILPALLEKHYEELEEEMETVFGLEVGDNATLDQRISIVVDHLISVAQRQPGLIRTLVLRNNLRPNSIPASIRATAQKLLNRLYVFLLESRSEMRHFEEEVTVEIGLLMVVAAIRERVVMVGATHSETLSVSHEVFASELKRALLAYLNAAR
jgi:AcrR family transcriptional regulator